MPLVPSLHASVFTSYALCSLQDAAGRSASRTFTVTIAPPLPSIGGSLPDARYQFTYSASLTIVGGVAPFSVSADDNTLPTGVTVSLSSPTSRLVSVAGTPGAFGDFNIAITVTDARSLTGSGVFALTVAPPAPPPSLTGDLPGGTVGDTYSASLAIADGDDPFTVGVNSGQLPNGLTLAVASRQVTLSGTPESVGDFSFTLVVQVISNPHSSCLPAFVLFQYRAAFRVDSRFSRY